MGEKGITKSMITSNPEILDGKPVVKGTRLSVEFIRGLLTAGWSEEQVLENYPQLSHKALQETLNLEPAILSEVPLSG